ncbi:hypothetical protein ACSSS7_001734 [Eimeria intestinalis]
MVASRGLKGSATPLASPNEAASPRNHSLEKKDEAVLAAAGIRVPLHFSWEAPGENPSAGFQSYCKRKLSEDTGGPEIKTPSDRIGGRSACRGLENDATRWLCSRVGGLLLHSARGKGSRIAVPESIPPFSTLCRTCSELDLQYWCLPPPLARRVPHVTVCRTHGLMRVFLRPVPFVPCFRAYASLGVTSLYPWQAECLHIALRGRSDGPETQGKADGAIYCAGSLTRHKSRMATVDPSIKRTSFLMQRHALNSPGLDLFDAGVGEPSWRSLIYCAPTSGGKSLVAEVLIARQDCLIPQVAATEEHGGTADATTPEGFGKAAGAVSCQSSEGRLGRARGWWDSLRRRLPSVAGELPVGMICVDEIHFIGDSQRGHLLEMLLAKLLFINQILQKPVQLLGMSATLSNVHQIARWLGTEVFVTDLRPSPLDVFVKVFAWSRGEGLKASRRLHEGSLCLPPAGDAATRAAARALKAAASASAAAAGGFDSEATQQTASGMGASNDCASLAAAALRFLRLEDSSPQDTASLTGSGEFAPRVEADARGEPRAGWQADAEHLGALSWEVLREGRRVIVFCPTQEWTAHTAGFLAKALPFYRRAEAWADLLKQRAAVCLEPQKHVQSTASHPQQEHHQQAPPWQHEEAKQHEQQQQAFAQARRELLGLPTELLAQLLVQSPHLYVEPHVLQGREELQWQLRQLARLPPTTMLAAIQEGVAYHHAGLSGDERECVEAGYRRGHLSVLCATSTLALGVNLPAARVIIRAPHVGRDEFLSPGRFHQMAGRAGRKGLENRGDAYLICSPATLPKVETLLSSVCAADTSGAAECAGEGGDGGAVTSCLRGQRLCRFVLEAVHVLLPLLLRPAQITSTGAPRGRAFFDVAAIVLQCTLRGHQGVASAVVEEIAECVRFLHAFYLLEAEPAFSLSPLDGDGDVQPSSEYSALKEEKTGQLQFVPGLVKSEENHEALPKTPARASSAVSASHTPSLQSLAFPASPLPAVCKLLLQQYPCLRSPVVLARMLQGGEFDKKQHPAFKLSSFVGSHSPLSSPLKSTKGASSECTSAPGSPLKGAGFVRHPSRVSAAATQEREVFSSRVRLYFRGLDALADQLASASTSPVCTSGSSVDHCSRGKWSDLGGRLAPTDVGAAAVEAGLAPWEAAELFADVFKTSIMGNNARRWSLLLDRVIESLIPTPVRTIECAHPAGLCAATELHLIFLAAVSIRTDTQPHWRSYASIYDGLDTPSRRVADSLGIRREVICNEAIRAQGAARQDANDNTLDLILADKLSFEQLTERIKVETHRRFFFALLLFEVYREGEAAALSEVCFMLAGKLKLACLPMGVVASSLAAPAPSRGSVGVKGLNLDNSEAAAFQQLLQLEGMTARRAVALRAAKINSCAELANAPVYEVFKALEAAEPAPLSHSSASSEDSQAASMYKLHRQRARLLAVTAKLKDAAQQEQATRLQALEDEAAAHWSLLGKVTERSGEETVTAGDEVSHV